jgi:hypothetical protein
MASVLADKDSSGSSGFGAVMGAKRLSEILAERGFVLTDRAVQYYLRYLDEMGFTQKVGNTGRVLTKAGIAETESLAEPAVRPVRSALSFPPSRAPAKPPLCPNLCPNSALGSSFTTVGPRIDPSQKSSGRRSLTNRRRPIRWASWRFSSGPAIR